MNVPILDNHVHLEPVRGRNVEAVKDFAAQGGTHIIVSHLPYEEIPVRSADDFRKSFEVTIATVERVNAETQVKAFATVGPYPVELLQLAEIHGLAKAKEIMLEGMEIAADLVRDGDALAIGEVGRPHFEGPANVLQTSNDILLHGMRLSREVDCAIVLHTEGATPEGMKGLAEMADRAGLDRGRVVKHYCGPLVRQDENFGLMPSVLASRDNVEAALSKGLRFMMETDFLDDPKRPGAVLAITTVPKRTNQLIEKKLLRLDDAYQIHYDNARMTYGPRFV
jgi:TatD-related deoxyribonuclease